MGTLSAGQSLSSCMEAGVEVDVISEWSWFEGESHTLQNHFLVEVGFAEGSFAEAVDEST